MKKKHNNVKDNLVHGENKLSDWDDLIGLAKRNVILANVRKEELEAAISIYEKKRDAGVPFPGVEMIWEIKN